MDGWNTTFLLGWPIFRCKLLVSGRVPLYSHLSRVFFCFAFSTEKFHPTPDPPRCQDRVQRAVLHGGVWIRWSKPLPLHLGSCNMDGSGTGNPWRCWTTYSKNFPTYPWNIPQTLNQQFMKEFFSFWGFGDAWGMLQGYVGILLDIFKQAFGRRKVTGHLLRRAYVHTELLGRENKVEINTQRTYILILHPWSLRWFTWKWPLWRSGDPH